MGRHLERARHGCRLLSDQLATMEDRPVEQIDQSWRRLYRAVDRSPLGGFLAASEVDEDFMLADAYDGGRPDLRAGQPRCATAWRRRARTPGRCATPSATDVVLPHLAYLDLRARDHLERPARRALPAYRGRHPHLHGHRRQRHVPRQRALSPARLVRRAHPAPRRARGCAHRAVPHRQSRRRGLALAAQDLRGAFRLPSSARPRPSAGPHRRLPGRRPPARAFGPPRAGPGRERAGRGRRRPVARGRSRAPRGPHGRRHRPRLARSRPRRRRATRAALQEIRESCRLLHDDIAATYFDYEIEDTP